MHRNRAKTVVLMGSVSAMIVVVGARWEWPGAAVGVSVAVALNSYVYLRCDVMILRAMRAYPVGEAEQPALYAAVRELTVRARVPMPRIYVSPTRAVNAFTTGRGPGDAAVCCTEGIIALLDERELRAVLAHELAHIRRRDTLASSVTGALARLIMMGTGGVLVAGGADSGRRHLLGRILLAVFGPLAAGVVRLTVPPEREYAADADAASLTGDPLGLASALRKLELSTRRLVLPPERDIVASSHVMIAAALQRSGIVKLFATHPPMGERVARLEQRAGYRR